MRRRSRLTGFGWVQTAAHWCAIFRVPGLQEDDRQPAPLPLAGVADMQRLLDLVANVALENIEGQPSPASASKKVQEASKKLAGADAP